MSQPTSRSETSRKPVSNAGAGRGRVGGGGSTGEKGVQLAFFFGDPQYALNRSALQITGNSINKWSRGGTQTSPDLEETYGNLAEDWEGEGPSFIWASLTTEQRNFMKEGRRWVSDLNSFFFVVFLAFAAARSVWFWWCLLSTFPALVCSQGTWSLAEWSDYSK